MGPSATALAVLPGDPAVGLVPSLLLAAVGLAIVLTVALDLMGEAPSEGDDGEPSEEISPDAEIDAEHTTDDVV